MPSYQKIFSLSILAFLLLFYGLLTAQEVDLVTADLGRHLKNGELFFADRFFIPLEMPPPNLTVPDATSHASRKNIPTAQRFLTG
ncbi:MAG: hypothetical protein G01um101433_1065 [Parcubacteria group bacterium Gr01-1014_33]|nr:MAG: hypothetical protein G01um101433_1065 [Parcubacteria group bacterium Gr01-1014_33]